MSDSEFDAVLIAKNARNATVHDLTGPLLQGTVQFERLNPRTMRVHAKESNFVAAVVGGTAISPHSWTFIKKRSGLT